jgi:hypothetical protein
MFVWLVVVVAVAVRIRGAPVGEKNESPSEIAEAASLLRARSSP